MILLINNVLISNLLLLFLEEIKILGKLFVGWFDVWLYKFFLLKIIIWEIWFIFNCLIKLLIVLYCVWYLGWLLFMICINKFVFLVFFKVDLKVVINVVGSFCIKLIVFEIIKLNLLFIWICCVLGFNVVNNWFFLYVFLFVKILNYDDLLVFV